MALSLVKTQIIFHIQKLDVHWKIIGINVHRPGRPSRHTASNPAS
jgi:hypothetical protein